MYRTPLPANLDALEPGSVLDALVAEHICGWVWVTCNGVRWLRVDNGLFETAIGDEKPTMHNIFPRWSTDPGAAIGLLESLKDLIFDACNSAVGGWQCTVEMAGQSIFEIDAHGKTFAHAITLALLKFKAAGGVVVRKEK